MSDEVRELLGAWVAGWCLSRGITATRWHDGWMAVVAAETRAVEYLLAFPDGDDLAAVLAATQGRPDAWLTVLGPVPKPVPQELDPVTHSERFMVAPLRPGGIPAAVSLHVEGEVAFATVSVDGERAAWGQVAVTPGGFAVVDRIGTDPAYRRRGLATEVMAGLTSWAATRGAATGLLFASEQGRRLYGSLGWQESAELSSWKGRPDA